MANAVDVDMLVDYAQELEDDTEGTGMTWLKTQRDAAAQLIVGSGVGVYTTTTVDGQTYSRSVTASPLDMFSALQSAIRRLRGDDVKITYPQFCGIPL